MEAIRYGLNLVRYYVSSKIYQLKPKKDAREDALVDRLRFCGISMVDINLALDNMPATERIPHPIRLPGAFEGRSQLVDTINSIVFNFSMSPENRNLDYRERASKITAEISQQLHAELAYDPQVFTEIMRANSRS